MTVIAKNDALILHDLQDHWPEVIHCLNSYSTVGWMAFAGSQPMFLRDDVLTVDVPDPDHARIASTTEHLEWLSVAVYCAMQRLLRVEVTTRARF
jgi:hypothetical protein